MDSPIKPSKPLPLVGISSCLLGLRVRYDGQGKYQPSVQEWIAPHVRLLPLCPESMAGMGIPRKPVNLIERHGQVFAVGRDDPELDVTERLRSMGRIVAKTYPDLCGYILQSRSPSCGFETTPIYNADQTTVVNAAGHGLFVSELLVALPGLPLLNDTELDARHITPFLQQVQKRQAQLSTKPVEP